MTHLFKHIDEAIAYCREHGHDFIEVDHTMEVLNASICFVEDSFYKDATYAGYEEEAKLGRPYMKYLSVACLLGTLRTRDMRNFRRIVDAWGPVDRCVIFHAARQGRWTAVLHLLLRGAEYDLDVAGYAAAADRWDVIDAIRERKFEYKQRALEALVKGGDVSRVKAFVEREEIDLKQQDMFLPYRAFSEAHIPMFGYLLEAVGGPLKPSWYEGYIATGDVEKIRLLHKYGCPVTREHLKYAEKWCRENKAEMMATLTELLAAVGA